MSNKTNQKILVDFHQNVNVGPLLIIITYTRHWNFKIKYG